nr:RHS repeat-associated core domain-containing protein [Paenibacillus oenotherae]
MKVQYIRGKGLIARKDANGKNYYLHNGHGDVIELRDSTGNTSVNRYTYDLWGNPLTTTESVSNPFRYSGEMWDQSAGLQYLRARWYDPSMGRFISKDTYEGQIDNPLSQNLYTYVENNPLIYTDPSGNKLEKDSR